MTTPYDGGQYVAEGRLAGIPGVQCTTCLKYAIPVYRHFLMGTRLKGELVDETPDMVCPSTSNGRERYNRVNRFTTWRFCHIWHPKVLAPIRRRGHTPEIVWTPTRVRPTRRVDLDDEKRRRGSATEALLTEMASQRGSTVDELLIECSEVDLVVMKCKELQAQIERIDQRHSGEDSWSRFRDRLERQLADLEAEQVPHYRRNPYP